MFMGEIKPISYANLIKHEFEIIEISNSTIIFNFVGSPFRVYSGKPIIFIYNGSVYKCKYYRNMFGGIYKHSLLVITKDGLAPGVIDIPISTLIDTYDTFNIDDENELPTIQDIIDILGIGSKNIIQSSYGTPTDITNGKFGLVSSEDRAKLDNVKYEIHEANNIELNELTFTQIFQTVLLSGMPIQYELSLRHATKLIKLELEVFYEVGQPLINVSVKNCNFDGLEIKFILNSYELPSSDIIHYLLVAVKDIEESAYKFTYKTPSILNNILSTGTFINSQIVQIANSDSIKLQTNTMNFDNNLINYPEINWNKKDW